MVKFVCMSLAEYKLSSSTFTIYYGLHECPFGKCLIGIISKDKAVCHLQFIDKYNSAKCINDFKSDWPGANFVEKIEETEKILEKIFSSKNHENISVFLKGTDFQINVWKALTKIPRAEVVNYSYIAELINNPKAIQAIAKVIGSNRVAYIIPCHRVISKSGPSKTCWRTDKRAPMIELDLEKKDSNMVYKVCTMNANEYNTAVNLSKFKIIYGINSSTFGYCLIGVTNDQNAICYLSFLNGNSPDVCLKIMADEWPGIDLIEDKSVTNEIIESIFSNIDEHLFIFLKGADFQIGVWKVLMTIPKGNTVSYSDVATMISNPKAIRAVATAIASNKIGYVVPCHRVLSKNGSNTKFRWGT